MNEKSVTSVISDMNSLASDCSFVILGSGPQSVDVNGCDNENESAQKLQPDNSNMKSSKTEAQPEGVFLNGRAMAHIMDAENDNDVQLKLDQLLKDNLLLKETLDQSNTAMKNQFSTLSTWYDEVMKTHESHKQKFLESQDVIRKLQTENANLKKKIEDGMETEKCSAILVNFSDEIMDEMKAKLAQSEEMCKSVKIVNEELCLKSKELEKRLNDAMEDKLSLQKKLEEALKENEQLKKDAEVRNNKCDKCQSSLDPNNGDDNGRNHNDKLCNAQASGVFVSRRNRFAELFETPQQTSFDVEKIKIQNEELTKERNELQNSLKTCRTILDQYRDQLKNSTAQVKAAEESLEAKSKELGILKKEMEKLLLDCESVAILRTQVEIYQSDFNEEREAREKAVDEKEKMAEEVRRLQREIDAMKGNVSTSSNQQPDVCFICLKRFEGSPEDWQAHVDNCLDTHASQ